MARPASPHADEPLSKQLHRRCDSIIHSMQTHQQLNPNQRAEVLISQHSKQLLGVHKNWLRTTRTINSKENFCLSLSPACQTRVRKQPVGAIAAKPREPNHAKKVLSNPKAPIHCHETASALKLNKIHHDKVSLQALRLGCLYFRDKQIRPYSD